jgi:hypothetical protein
MKKITITVRALAVLSALFLLPNLLRAQYTLTSNDVVVENGVIVSCSYDFSETDIIIPETLDGQTIIALGDEDVFNPDCFYDKGITSIVLPSSLLEIGENALKSNDITSIEFPENLEVLGYSCLGGNSYQFDSIVLPSSLRFIDSYALSMNGIDSIILPVNSHDDFQYWLDEDGNVIPGGTIVAYEGAKYKAKIPYTFTESDVTIDENGYIIACEYDFENGSKDIKIPAELGGVSIVGLGDGSFSGTFGDKGIETLELAEGIKVIANNTFKSNSLQFVDFPESLKVLGDNSFYGNDLDSISLKGNVRYIGTWALGSNDFDSITLPVPYNNEFEYWIDVNGLEYKAGTKVFVFYGNGFEAKEIITLTEDEITLDQDTIVSCSYDFSSSYIKIPNTVGEVEVKAIADGVKNANSSVESVFSNKGIKEVVLPENLEYIGDYAFYNNELTAVIVLPVNVSYIGTDAFTRNSSFEGVVLPSPVKQGSEFKNWIDSYGNTFNAGDTVKNFFAKSYSAQFVNKVNENTSLAFTCYPNPTSGKVFVENSKGVDYKIVDLMGRVVDNGVLTSVKSNIDFSTVSNGIYVLELFNAQGQSYQEKIVKQ